MQGQILGNRYELIEKIGGGGMAIVYKAKCRFLNRFVAVKILRSEYTNDEEFVKRFLIEAQSAASLSHPNIVSIYDVGHENNMHYIVMEFVNGVTLKEFITKKGSLLWKDAVNISIQICSAIEHAHRNHIVHRDIKPHNILLTEDGIAKVTDFGIARAVSSSTITMVGTTIGSVHYFSPEQARGGYIGEKSDIYSLGIALYEMVTGKIPFDGETPVAVALKHIQEEALPPKDVNPSIPGALNDIILKAIKKEQDERYKTATDMLQDLYRVMNEPEGDFVKSRMDDSSPTRRIKVINDDTLKEKDESNMKGKEGGGPKRKKDKKTIWLAIATCASIIIVFAIMAFMFAYPGDASKKKSGIEVTNYIGRNIDEVKSELEAENITVKVSRRNDDEYDKDIVVFQSIDAGKTLKSGGYIDLQVSDGPRMVKVPDVVKNDTRVAETKIRDTELTSKIIEENHDTIPEGYVIKTDPEQNTMVKVGSEVVIYKSTGPEIRETKVPSLIGLTRQEAMKALSDAKLTVGTIKPGDSSNEVAKVINQDPQKDTVVKEGSAVNLTFETEATEPDTPTNTNQNSNQNPGTNSQNTLKRTLVNDKINLIKPQDYGDKINVHVEILPSDTSKMEILMDQSVSKSNFPISISIPVPEKGKTLVQVYLDNKPYSSFTKP